MMSSPLKDLERSLSVLWAVDLGNTNAKLALFDNTTEIHAGQAPQKSLRLEYPLAARHLEPLLEWPTPQRVLMVSSNPKATAAFNVAMWSLFGAEFLLEEVTALPVVSALNLNLNGYPVSRLGVDRLVNLVTALAECPDVPCLVVDAGSAITMDLLIPGRGFVGGAIQPGARHYTQTLESLSSRLPGIASHQFLVNERHLPPALGMHTQACLLSGYARGYIGGIITTVQGLLREADRLWQVPPNAWRIVLTGGDALLVSGLLNALKHEEGPTLPVTPTVDDCWTLRGLLHLGNTVVTAPPLGLPMGESVELPA
jgi:type III pantothenate kinase